MKKRLLLIVLPLLTLPSCSRISFGYRFADWAVEGRVDDYLDLTSKQKSGLEKELDQYFLWHKKIMMPQYADLLAKIHSIVAEQKWTTTEWQPIDDLFDKLYVETAKPLEPILAKLLTDLSKEQVDHLKEKLAEENKENKEKFVDKAKDHEKEKIERNLETFKTWCGSPSDEQAEEITSMSKEVAFPIPQWLHKREKQQGVLLALIKAEPVPLEPIKKFIGNYVSGASTPITAEYVKARADFRKNLSARFLKLMSSLSEKQRAHLMERLKDYEKQLRDIAKD